MFNPCLLILGIKIFPETEKRKKNKGNKKKNEKQMWKRRVRPQKHMQTRWKLSGVLHVLRRRRMRKREKCQSGTAGKTHSEGPWVLHCSLVVSYIKIWVGFPFFTLCCCYFWPAAVEWATRDKTRVGERESGKTEKYILVGCGNQILSWTSISSVSVCLSLFSGDCHCGVWRCQLRFRWLPTLTCRQWRQLQRSVSICKLYVLSPPENQMSFKVNLKHIFYFTFFWNIFPYSFQSLHAIGKVRE